MKILRGTNFINNWQSIIYNSPRVATLGELSPKKLNVRYKIDNSVVFTRKPL